MTFCLSMDGDLTVPRLGDMATERQVEANRRNALRSTGPRSARGKKRSSQNSYRHGFGTKRGAHDEEVEKLAREFVGPNAEWIDLELARQAAEAHLTVRCIKQTTTCVINRILTFGELRAQEPHVPRMPVKALWNFLEICRLTETFPRPPDATKTMPIGASDRTAEFIRRALPEIVKLERYARRAVRRRDAAVRRLLTRCRGPKPDGAEVQNEPNFSFGVNGRLDMSICL